MTDRCGAGVILIGVRGTGEPAGMGGTVGAVKTLFDLDKDFPTWSQAISYPAVAISASDSYVSSVGKGTKSLRALIQTIAVQCPHASINLAGYSQGAHVVGNAISGVGVAPLSSTERARITSVVLFGDPTFRAGQAWNSNSSGTGNGLFARQANFFSSFTRLAYPSASATKPVQTPIVRSYCYAGDRWCQKGLGKDADSIHESYRTRSTSAAFDFIAAWNSSAKIIPKSTSYPIVPEG